MALASDMASLSGRNTANQDWAAGYTPGDPAWLADRGSCYVVCDGVGGAQAGRVASKLAGQTVLQWYFGSSATSRGDALRAALVAANQRVREASTHNPLWQGMAATVVAAVVHGATLLVGHLGDSRAYLIRGGRPYLLTRDHTWVQGLIDAGMLTPTEAGRHPYRHVITRFAGMGPTSTPDLNTFALQPGDTLVLCTDGVTDRLGGGEMARLAAGRMGGHPATSLVRRARQLGSGDDATAVVVRYEPQRQNQPALTAARVNPQALQPRGRGQGAPRPGPSRPALLDSLALAGTCVLAVVSIFAALLSM